MKSRLISRFASLAALAVLPVSVTVPHAVGQDKWSLGVKVGSTLSTSGDFHRGPSFDGSVLLGLEPGSLPVEVDVKDFDDVYGSFTEYALEAGYSFRENAVFYFGLSKLTSGSGTLQVGTVAGSLPLMARFGGYDDIGLYTGVRYLFASESAWTPFISAQVGIKDVDAIDASFYVPDVTFVSPFDAALTGAPFYDGGTVMSGGIGLGVTYRASENWEIGIETGYYLQGSLGDDDSVLSVLGLDTLNDEGRLRTIPITVSASMRF